MVDSSYQAWLLTTGLFPEILMTVLFISTIVGLFLMAFDQWQKL